MLNLEFVVDADDGAVGAVGELLYQSVLGVGARDSVVGIAVSFVDMIVEVTTTVERFLPITKRAEDESFTNLGALAALYTAR